MSLIKIQLNTELSTSGDGYWSSAKKDVFCKMAEVAYISDDYEFGELRVYFDTGSWDTNQHGLIYTDNQFIEELCDSLIDIGFTLEGTNAIDYSEQGMQGHDYVSFDIKGAFIQEASEMAEVDVA